MRSLRGGRAGEAAARSRCRPGLLARRPRWAWCRDRASNGRELIDWTGTASTVGVRGQLLLWAGQGGGESGRKRGRERSEKVREQVGEEDEERGKGERRASLPYDLSGDPSEIFPCGTDSPKTR